MISAFPAKPRLNFPDLIRWRLRPALVVMMAAMVPPGGGQAHFGEAFGASADPASVPVVTVSEPPDGLSEVEVEAFGAKGDGVTDDTRAINAAAVHLKKLGGGVLLFSAHKTYRLSRFAPGDQGPSIRLGPKVSIEGRGATLLQADDASFVGSDFETTTQAVVTADITPGMNTLTLDSTAGFAVGDTVFARLGDNPYDPREPRLTIIAQVMAVTGNTLTLDRVFMDQVAVTAAKETGNRCVRKVTSLWCDAFARDLVFHTKAGNVAESGIALQGCKNDTIENITSYDQMGAGLLCVQFGEHIRARNLTCYSNPNPRGQASMGRLIGCSNTTDMVVSDFYGANLTGAVFFIESFSRDIRFTNFHIDDLTPRRDGAPFAAVIQEAGLELRDFTCQSVNNFKEVDPGGTAGHALIENATYVLTRLPFSMGVADHFGRLDMTVAGQRSLYDFSSPFYASTLIPLTDGLQQAVRSPPGVVAEAEVYAPENFVASRDLVAFYLGRWPGENGTNVRDRIVAGSRVNLAVRPGFNCTVMGGLYATQERRMGGSQILIHCPATGVTARHVWLAVRWKLVPPLAGSDGLPSSIPVSQEDYLRWLNAEAPPAAGGGTAPPHVK